MSWRTITTVRPRSCDEAVEQVEHVDLVGEVEERRRLVEQQQLGLLRERHRDPRALALAAGELVERPVAQVGRCRSRRAPPRPPPRRRRTTGGTGPGAGSGRARRGPRPSGPRARPATAAGGRAGARRSRERQLADRARRRAARLPGARLQQPRERAQQRRLAAAVGADDRGDPLARDREVEPVDDVGARRSRRSGRAPRAARRRPPAAAGRGSTAPRGST